MIFATYIVVLDLAATATASADDVVVCYGNDYNDTTTTTTLLVYLASFSVDWLMI